MKNSNNNASQNHDDIRNRTQNLRLDTSFTKSIPLPKTLSSITEEPPEESPEESPEKSPSQPLSASNITPEKSQSK